MESKNDISFELVKSIGLAANEHANNKIKKTSTRLEVNDIPKESAESIATGIEDTINSSYESARTNFDPLVKNKDLLLFEALIRKTSKYSLGNCLELAAQALDYVLNNVKENINAEVFYIFGGDHAFLVINREGGDDNDPLSWGPNAIICDPWSGKVYPAKELKNELKNFYRKDEVNYVEDFDDTKHKLMRVGDEMNVLYLRQERTIPKLKGVFGERTDSLIKILLDYQGKLQSEKTRLDQEYGDNKKSKILEKKISEIKNTLEIISSKINSCLEEPYKNDYSFAKKEMTIAVKTIYNEVVSSMEFQKTELTKLFNPKLSFFSSNETHTEPHLLDITKETNQALNKALR